MEIKFIPPCCESIEELSDKGEKTSTPGTFQGHILVDVPAYPDRARFKQSVYTKAMPGESSKEKLQAAAYDLMAAAADLVKPMVKAVAIRRTGDPMEAACTDVGTLYADPKFDEVMQELATFALGGFKPSLK